MIVSPSAILYISCMFTFFWNHKILSFLIICGLIYWFGNPSHKFGFVTKNLVIYNRMPISFFDVYISEDGSLNPVENFQDQETQRKFLADLMQTRHENGTLLIVGTGFSRLIFSIPDSVCIKLETKNITVKQLPSDQAIQLYNESVDSNKTAAIILSIRH